MIDDILITGSSGTIGTALMEQLISKGYEIRGADTEPNPWVPEFNDRTHIVDLCDPDEVDTLPTDVDAIVHLGAHARVYELVKEPRLALENLEMSFNILEHARRSEISNFIFASSREVYGNSGQIIFSENETNVDKSESPYTASKIGGEAMVQAFSQCYDLSTCIVRFSNVYGRYDRSNRIIPLFIAQSERGRPLTVYGSGKVLDFTYLDDGVRGLTNTIEQFSTVKGETLNISSGQGTSLVELAHSINERTSGDSEVRIEPSREGEVKRYVGDIAKAEKMIGYHPEYSFEEGLQRTIDWYLDQPSVLREIEVESSE